jgi:hypothetical protein
MGSASSEFDTFVNKVVQPGDQIRVMGRVENGILKADVLETTVLVKPNPTAFNSNREDRRHVYRQLSLLNSAISENDVAKIREQYALVMGLKKTVLEEQSLRQLTKDLPKDEFLLTHLNKPLIDKLNEGFAPKFDFSAMSQKDLYDFVEAWAEGKIEPKIFSSPGRNDVRTVEQSLVYDLLEDLKALNEYQVRILEKNARRLMASFGERHKLGETYSHAKDYSYNSLLRSSLERLTFIPTEMAVKTFANLAVTYRQTGLEQFFENSPGRTVEINEMVLDTIHTLKNAGHPEWADHLRTAQIYPNDQSFLEY